MPHALWGNNMRNKSVWAYVSMPVHTNRHAYAHTRLIYTYIAYPSFECKETFQTLLLKHWGSIPSSNPLAPCFSYLPHLSFLLMCRVWRKLRKISANCKTTCVHTQEPLLFSSTICISETDLRLAAFSPFLCLIYLQFKFSLCSGPQALSSSRFVPLWF